MTNDEIEDYDLSTTGTIVEIENTSGDTDYGVLFESDAPVDLVIEADGGTIEDVTVQTFNSRKSVSAAVGNVAVVDLRLVNTTTAPGTADAALGSGPR
jgi:hypothetical protein